MRRTVDGSMSLVDPGTSRDHEGVIGSALPDGGGSLHLAQAEPALPDGRGSFDWSNLDRYFTASPLVDDGVPDGLVDGRLATKHDDAASGPIPEDRDDFFAALA
jgi:hypothetical protein